MTNFDVLLLQSKNGSKTAATEILEMYQPLLIKESVINGIYDEDSSNALCAIIRLCRKSPFASVPIGRPLF